MQTSPTSGADCSADPDGLSLAKWGYAFTAASGVDHPGNDFGNFELITKSGKKIDDVSKEGLQGWTIKLYSDSGSDAGNLDAGDTLITTKTTIADGSYSFPNLGPGSYIVCEELQTGWEQKAPTSGADCSYDSALGAKGYAFTAVSGVDHPDNHFANAKLFRLIVITCSEATGELVVSTVSVDGALGGTKDTISTPPSGVTHSDLCNLAGARYEDLPADTYSAPSIVIPK
jgi:hypothetical protein